VPGSWHPIWLTPQPQQPLQSLARAPFFSTVQQQRMESFDIYIYNWHENGYSDYRFWNSVQQRCLWSSQNEKKRLESSLKKMWMFTWR
jgi:hypothetical protein